MSAPSIKDTFEMEEIDYRELNSAMTGLKVAIAERQKLQAQAGSN